MIEEILQAIAPRAGILHIALLDWPAGDGLHTPAGLGEAPYLFSYKAYLVHVTAPSSVAASFKILAAAPR